MKRLTCLVIFLIFYSVNSEELNFKKKIPVKIAREGEDLSQKADVFVPTHEWQVVKPEQTVPRGLHIRMNLETGNVEAKLLDADSHKDSSSNSAVVHVKQKDSEIDEKPSETDYDSSELQEILRKIKDDAGASKPSVETFRSYEEIKQDLAGLNFSVKTDAEIIKDLFIKFRNTSESSVIVNILHDLEYYIHQYDNALDFIKMGGFRDIILPSLNSTLDDLRSSAAFLLGSATQSNPKAQIAALELSLIPQLLRLIANDESYKVRNSALYALSCISRHFPLAQGEIVSQGGISALAKIFENESAESLKLQMKIVTLFNDFVTERNEPDEPQVRNAAENELHEEKKRQYEKVRLEKALVEQGFCKLITKLLNELNLDDLSDKHDSVEKVLQAMVSFSTLCGKEFNDNVPQLKKLIHFYRNLSQEEMDEENEHSDSDLYFTSLLEMSEALLTKINMRDEL